jgi:futalosine hydrolase
LGTEAGTSFLTLAKMGLEDDDTYPLDEGWLKNQSSPAQLGISLPSVKGLSVNMVTGTDDTAHLRYASFGAQTESMEGAALHYACLMEEVPFAQLRAISNYAERRNRAAWQLMPAIMNLNDWLIAYLSGGIAVQLAPWGSDQG